MAEAVQTPRGRLPRPNTRSRSCKRRIGKYRGRLRAAAERALLLAAAVAAARRSTARIPCRRPGRTASENQGHGWRSSLCTRPVSLERAWGRGSARGRHTVCNPRRRCAGIASRIPACGWHSSSYTRRWPATATRVLRAGTDQKGQWVLNGICQVRSRPCGSTEMRWRCEPCP